MKLVFLDFEAFLEDWLVCITEQWEEDGEQKTQDLVIVNDRKELMKYYYANYKTCIFIGHNIGRYDYPLFIGIMEGLNHKKVSDALINTNIHWKMANIIPNYNNYEFTYIDTCQDASKMKLKEFEGYADLPIVTTEVEFDLNRKLTKEELDLTIKYCKADVYALIKLFNLTRNSIETKMRLIIQNNMSRKALSYTNAKLVDELLATTQKRFDDEYQPFNFDLIPVKPSTKEIVDFFDREVNYDENKIIRMCGMWLTYAYGGLHGALPNFKYEGEIWLADVSSLYPSIMIYYDFFSRNMDTKSKRKYIDIYFDRLKCKAEDNKALKLVIDKQIKFFKEHTQYGEFTDETDWSVEHKANSKQADVSKLVLNTSYGTFKDQYKKLYDPRMANNICIAGQLIMTVLIERLSPYITPINVNTDGIYFILKDKSYNSIVLDIIHQWEEDTSMSMEVEKASKIYQKDVNNYIMKMENGKIKTKGGMTRQYIGNKKAPIRQSLAVIDDCLCEYFMNGTPVKWTLLKTQQDNPTRFKQMLLGSSKYNKYVWFHNGKEEPLGQITRVYATINNNCGGVSKIKTNAIRKTGETYIQYNKFPDTSDNLYVDNDLSFDFANLDLNYYEQLANKRIREYEEER